MHLYQMFWRWVSRFSIQNRIYHWLRNTFEQMTIKTKKPVLLFAKFSPYNVCLISLVFRVHFYLLDFIAKCLWCDNSCVICPAYPISSTKKSWAPWHARIMLMHFLQFCAIAIGFCFHPSVYFVIEQGKASL